MQTQKRTYLTHREHILQEENTFYRKRTHSIDPLPGGGREPQPLSAAARTRVETMWTL